MKILIADDDPVSRQLMEMLLRKSGYQVIAVGDGEAALARLAVPDAPRLALLDWMMPGLDGLEVCRRIRVRKDAPYVHVTLLTSKFEDDDIVAGLEAGADDYLTKPCNPKELTARLRTGHRILELEDTLVRAREEMRFSATHDSLTRLWNHGEILRLVQEELISPPGGPAAALVLGDLDHFKQINDTHGHLAGDEVLRQVSKRLAGAVGPGDEVGRYGGEEFLVLLRNCSSEDELKARAETLRASICGTRFGFDGASIPVSISIGCSSIQGKGEQSLELFLKAIDAALYRAKAAGRNRVVCSPIENA